MGLALGRLAVLLAPLALAAAALLAIPVDEARADSGHPGGSHPLHQAAGEDGDLAAVVHLLGSAHGIDVNAKHATIAYPHLGGTPLHEAARYGRATIAATLIAAGAEVNAKGKRGSTPLHGAALGDSAPVVSLLLAAGAEVNVKNNSGDTPLHWAASRSAPIVSLLLAAGADVNAKGYANDTPLHEAASGPVASALLAAGAEVNAKNNFGRTPLRDTCSVEECSSYSAPIRAVLMAAGGHWGELCTGRAIVNPAHHNPPCLCESPHVETNLGACESVAVCDSPAALDAAANRCDCPVPNAGTDGAVAPGDCAAPSVESCGGLTPSEFYDATAGECAAFRECHTGATLNRDANLCECAGAAALDPAGTGCLCESPNLGTPTDCQAPSESVCAGLTPPEFFDETRVSITAGECVPFMSCPTGAALDRQTNTCEFNTESCGSLTPPLFYDSNTEECGDRLYPCHDSAVRKDDNSGCECPPERPFSHGDPSAGVWRYRSGRCLEYRFGRCRRYGEGQWHQSIPTSAECLADHAPIAHDLGGWLSAVRANNPTLVAHFIAGHNQHPDGSNALHRAAENDSHLAAIALIAGGANVNLNHGVTPLHVAIHNGAARVASVLLSANANPDAANSRGDAPLHLAAKRGDAAENAALVSLLLAGGANPDLKNSDGDTPLHSATRAGLARMISILLATDANPNLQNNDRWHPLDLAYHGGTIAAGKVFAPHPRRRLMAALVAGGGGLADANRRNNDDETPLHLETQAGREEFVLWLLQRGANPDFANAQSETPLHLAARDSAFGIVKHLLDHEANPNAIDSDGDTVLHESVRLSDAAGNVALVSLLLDKGADPNIRNRDGWRPLDLAYDNGGRRDARLARRMMMAALIAGGADWASECTGGKIPNEHYRPPEVSDCRCPNHLAVDNNGVCECPAETHAAVNGRCLGKGSAQLDEEIEIVRAELAELRAALVSLNLRLSLAAEAADGPQEELEEVAALAAEAARGIARRRDVFRALGRADLAGAAPVVGLSDTAATCRMLGGDVEGDARVCSGIDFNDTFCLIDSDAALSCVGLFRHVRRCNDDFNRPALDPWHCAARCPSGLRARGARCASD